MSIHRDLITLKMAARSLPPLPDAQRCLQLVHLGKPYDLIFFSEIADPAWIDLLEVSGYYHFTPNPLPAGSRIGLPYLSLVNVASKAPEKVVRILEKVILPRDGWTSDLVMRTFSLIAGRQHILRLKPIVEQFVKDPKISSWIWVNDAIGTWMESEVYDLTLLLVKGYLHSVFDSDKEDSGRSRAWMMAEVDKNSMEPLMQHLPLELTVVLCEALSAYALRELPENRDISDKEPSTYWLEDFKSAQDSSSTPEAIVAARLYSVASHIYSTSVEQAQIDQLDEVLRTQRWGLFQRLRWQLYADHPEKTLRMARMDVLQRIPHLGMLEASHGYEFAQLLDKHSTIQGSKFLSEAELASFLKAVLSGPLRNEGANYALEPAEFHRFQIKPIASLLRADERATYLDQTAASSVIDFEGYKPIRTYLGEEAREMEELSPYNAPELANLSTAELWNRLNTWRPTEGFDLPSWWVRQTPRALFVQFAELLETAPALFDPNTAWWKNINPPACFSTILDRATRRIASDSEDNREKRAPSDYDWATWFGITAWVSEQELSLGNLNPDRVDDPDSSDQETTSWNGAKITAGRFLSAAISAVMGIPESQNSALESILRNLISGADSQLDRCEITKYRDWLTTAINSSRGIAIECLIDLALSQKKRSDRIDPWIPEVLFERLAMPEESPAIFAIVGSKLRLLIFLFAERPELSSERLFPVDRISQGESLIISHFLYDSPMKAVFVRFPNILTLGLEVYSQLIATGGGAELRQANRDFGTQLGLHIAFYQWTGVDTSSGQDYAAMDRFFLLAPVEARAKVIGEIAHIFGKTVGTQENHELLARVTRLWEHRFEQICSLQDQNASSSESLDAELASFTRWMSCECWDFGWRADFCLRAIGRLKSPPESFELLKALSESSDHPERLDLVIEILHALLLRATKELMWSVGKEELGPIISKGLASSNQRTRELADACLDALLRQEKFEFLDLGLSESSRQ